jgi:hypothetical protein
MYKIIKIGFIDLHITYTLSWVVIPFIIFIYYKYPKYRHILFNTFIVVAVIGTYKSIQERYDKNIKHSIQNRPNWQFFLGILLHLGLLFVLKDFYKYGYFNIYSLYFMILQIFIIYLLPWWPYPTSTRLEFIYYIIAINLILYLLWEIIYKK